MIAKPKPRVSAVSYLNTVPLVWGMLHGEQSELFDLSFSLPAECASDLANGSVSIGLVPCIELARQPLRVIPGAGIACHGAVRSILLVSKVPFAQIETLAVDSSSRTSVMLTRIVLEKKYGIQPEFHSHPPNLPAMLDHADACLIIGDPALHLDPATLPFHVMDLGAEWFALTGLPMVFAVWASRTDAPPEPFMDSLRFGKSHIDEIVDLEYKRRGITRELAHGYLTRVIVFELGAKEYQGMALFLEYAAAFRNRMDTRTVIA